MLKAKPVVAAVLALGLVLGGSGLAFTQDRPARPGGGERHPQIRAAMRALNMAAGHLERAATALQWAAVREPRHGAWRQLGEDLLRTVVDKGGRAKIAKMAKSKLALVEAS